MGTGKSKQLKNIIESDPRFKTLINNKSIKNKDPVKQL